MATANIAPVVGARYIMTRVSATQPGDKYLKGRVVIAGGKTTERIQVRVMNVEDAGDYWHFGYEPIGPDVGYCRFGYARLYKDKTPEYGVIEMRPL